MSCKILTDLDIYLRLASDVYEELNFENELHNTQSASYMGENAGQWAQRVCDLTVQIGEHLVRCQTCKRPLGRSLLEGAILELVCPIFCTVEC